VAAGSASQVFLLFRFGFSNALARHADASRHAWCRPRPVMNRIWVGVAMARIAERGRIANLSVSHTKRLEGRRADPKIRRSSSRESGRVSFWLSWRNAGAQRATGGIFDFGKAVPLPAPRRVRRGSPGSGDLPVVSSFCPGHHGWAKILTKIGSPALLAGSRNAEAGSAAGTFLYLCPGSPVVEERRRSACYQRHLRLRQSRSSTSARPFCR